MSGCEKIGHNGVFDVFSFFDVNQIYPLIDVIKKSFSARKFMIKEFNHVDEHDLHLLSIHTSLQTISMSIITS